MDSKFHLNCKINGEQFKIPIIIISSEIFLEIKSLNLYKESLISMVIETFDRLRPGLNSFHGELL